MFIYLLIYLKQFKYFPSGVISHHQETQNVTDMWADKIKMDCATSKLLSGLKRKLLCPGLLFIRGFFS